MIRIENVKNITEYESRIDEMIERKKDMAMALKKKPLTGMKDMMPAEMEIRDYVIG